MSKAISVTYDDFKEDFKYVLSYQCGNDTVEMKFGGDVTLSQLMPRLCGFLKHCSWLESQLREGIKELSENEEMLDYEYEN